MTSQPRPVRVTLHPMTAVRKNLWARIRHLLSYWTDSVKDRKTSLIPRLLKPDAKKCKMRYLVLQPCQLNQASSAASFITSSQQSRCAIDLSGESVFPRFHIGQTSIQLDYLVDPLHLDAKNICSMCCLPCRSSNTLGRRTPGNALALLKSASPLTEICILVH